MTKKEYREYLQNEHWQRTYQHDIKSDVFDVSDSGVSPQPGILPPFPLEFFPDSIRKALQEIAESVNTPVEIPATALISIVGACIGRTRGIQCKRGWVEHPNLYIALIGASGMGKSPGTRHIFKHIQELEETNDRQVIVDDATIEALTDVLNENPKGALWYRDELTGMFLDFDKYEGRDGATKQRLMSAYNSEPWRVNRADMDRNKLIPHATLSIYGTIQPSSLKRAFSYEDIVRGFFPRFLFVVASKDSPSVWSDVEVSEATDMVIHNLIKHLFTYDFEKSKPVILELSDDAKGKYVNWNNEVVTASWYSTEHELKKILTKKLQAQCLRLALITHFIDAEVNEPTDYGWISIESVEKAIMLTECLQKHQLYALQLMTDSTQVELSPIQRRALNAILKLEPEIVKGMLSTARITEVMNEGMEDCFHFEARSVGKALSDLRLKSKHMPDGNSRGFVILPEDISRLKEMGTIPSETSDMSEIE
ncbi:DUF3987 domain-containing protein [Candidatus Latescibacterota bacterium]